MDEDLKSFSQQVADRVSVCVDHLIHTTRPPGTMERCEYRKETSLTMNGEGEKISVGNYSCLIEKDMDTVRTSLRIQWRNAEGCWTSVLDTRIQTAFYNRLSRSCVVDWLRKVPIPGYDVSFLFTADDDPVMVRKFLVEAILSWRTLTRQIRVRQIIINRKCANGLFKNILNFPKKTLNISPILATPAKSPNKTMIPTSIQDNWSVRTDACDIRSVAELDDLIREIENEEPSFLNIDYN
jgi:hypothetical protein